MGGELYNYIIKCENILKSDSTTTNHELEKLINEFKLTDIVIGVYDCNYNLNLLPRRKYVIMNTINSKSGDNNIVGHWVFFYRADNGKLYFYDSYERQSGKLNKMWQKYKAVTIINGLQNQSLYSKNCGMVTMACILLCRKYNDNIEFVLKRI